MKAEVFSMPSFWSRGVRVLPLAALVSLGAIGACSAPSKGALVLAVSTDMQAPKDIDVVSVYITTNGAPKFNYMGRVLPDGTVSLPATLAIVEPDEQGAEIRIRVVAFQTQSGGGANTRVLRDVLTTVPHERTALLRVPLDFLDDGSGMGMVPSQYVPGPGASPDGLTAFDLTRIVSKCDWTNLKQTSVSGVCTGALVDSSTLESFVTSEVFGDGGMQANGAPASCFDPAICFAQPSPVVGLDMRTCSFPMPAGANPSTLNVALVAPGTGTCTAQGCFVPLPNDATAGWTVQGGNVVLVPGVCAKLSASVSLAVSAGACAAHMLSEPVCEPGEFMAPPDAGASCDGNYVLTCAPDPTCGAGSGGSAAVSVTGTQGTITPPGMAGGTSPSIALTVDPATCVASFSAPTSAGACNLTQPITIQLATGTVSGAECSVNNIDGGCTTVPLQCTVARGTLDAGAGAGADAGPLPPPDASTTMPCPSGMQLCNGACLDVTSNASSCGACGRGCAAGQMCMQSQCVAVGPPDAGAPDAGAKTCVPRSCIPLGFNCGYAGDGCGGSLNCGTCSGSNVCGSGGFNKCGMSDGGACIPQTCQAQGINCGPTGDGCGSLIPTCGGCTAPMICGGGGVPGQCG
jgi:hypothetical protein